MSDSSDAPRRDGAPLGGEVGRARQVRRFEQLLPRYRAQVDWPAPRLDRERSQALRRLLEVAVGRSSWHRARLCGVDVARLSAADLAGLPVMTKTDLMDNFDEIVTDPRLTRARCEEHLAGDSGEEQLLGQYHVIASSGSSGSRGVYVYGFDAWAICYASIVRFQDRDWVSDPALAGVARVTAMVAASKPTHLSAAIGRTFSSPRLPRHLFPVTWPLEKIVQGLNTLQPTVLAGYSSFLPRLAQEALAGRLRISPRRVGGISEPLLPEARALLEHTWGVPVADGYGLSEGLFTGFCGHGNHLPDDLCLIEAVDAAGKPVPPGVASHHIYLTTLYNHTLPLIRFEITDEITLLDDGPCPCGSPLRRIADPLGRLDDTFTYPHAVRIHPHVFRSALSSHTDIVEYQVRQTLSGADIRLVAAPPTATAPAAIDTTALGRGIEHALAQLGLDHPHVTITPVAAIDRAITVKLPRFLPLQPPPSSRP